MPTFSGPALSNYLDSPLESFPYIAESLLYERACIMFSADPGIGKSVLSTQAALELAAGLDVFGAFRVTRPYRVLYIQKERPLDEIRERIQAMRHHIKFDPANLTITDELQRYTLTDPNHAKQAVNFITKQRPEVIILDPIYAGQADLKSGEAATAFTNFLTLLEYATKACLWLNHHTVKTQLDRDGTPQRRQDPFYGSQWLKAHISGSFYIQQNHIGTLFSCKKDSHSRLIKTFALSFDPETYLSTFPNAVTPGLEKVKSSCEAFYRSNKSFTIYDIMSRTGLSRRSVMGCASHQLIKDRLKVVSVGSHGKKSYTYDPV